MIWGKLSVSIRGTSAPSQLNFGIEPNALASGGVTAIVALNHPRLTPLAQAVTPIFSCDKALGLKQSPPFRIRENPSNLRSSAFYHSIRLKYYE